MNNIIDLLLEYIDRFRTCGTDSDKPASQRIAMLHIGRCGSSVLARQLEKHKTIQWSREIYEPHFKKLDDSAAPPPEPFDPFQHLEATISGTDRPIFGLEIKPYHLRLLGCTKEDFLNHLVSIGFEHFIILDRENKLRKILSSLKAHQSGVFHLKPGTSPKLEKIHIDPQRIPIDRTSKPLLQFLQEYERDMQEFTDLLPKKSTHFLTYERDIERDPYIGYLKICNILNLRPHRKRIPLSKTTPFPVRQLVENYDDLQAILRGTPYEWMLEECV